VSAWLTVAQVAEEEQVSPRTVLRWIERGQLQARRQPGGRLRIHESWYRALTDGCTMNLNASGPARLPPPGPGTEV
jgi:excisionase family DNA binding protein